MPNAEKIMPITIKVTFEILCIYTHDTELHKAGSRVLSFIDTEARTNTEAEAEMVKWATDSNKAHARRECPYVIVSMKWNGMGKNLIDLT